MSGFSADLWVGMELAVGTFGDGIRSASRVASVGRRDGKPVIACGVGMLVSCVTFRFGELETSVASINGWTAADVGV